MFFDIGPLELVALIILAVLIFGPEKLPKVIQDVAGFIRKVRQFSDSAKEDIRSELGPEFKDFDFEDLNPKNFARKHLMNGEDEYGLKEIRNGFDLRKELDDVTDAVNGTERAGGAAAAAGAAGGAAATAGGTKADLRKDGDAATDQAASGGKLTKSDPPPFDADAT